MASEIFHTRDFASTGSANHLAQVPRASPEKIKARLLEALTRFLALCSVSDEVTQDTSQARHERLATPVAENTTSEARFQGRPLGGNLVNKVRQAFSKGLSFC